MVGGARHQHDARCVSDEVTDLREPRRQRFGVRARRSRAVVIHRARELIDTAVVTAGGRDGALDARPLSVGRYRRRGIRAARRAGGRDGAWRLERCRAPWTGYALILGTHTP